MPPAPDHLDFPRVIARLGRCILVLAALGAVVLYALKGRLWAQSYLLGAGAALANFWFLRTLVGALNPAAGPPARAGRFALILRVLLLGGGAFVILKSSGYVLPALFLGLSTVVAAAVLEVIYELFYARI